MQIVNSIEDLRKRKKEIMTSRFGSSGNDVYSIIYDESLISAINSKISDFEKKLIPINKEKENKRLEYMEAQKNKKVIEKLKEKKAYQHKKQEILKESKAIDDLVNTRFKKFQEV